MSTGTVSRQNRTNH